MNGKKLPISMRGFAEVAAEKPSRKSSKLKRYKFRDSEESIGRSNFYVWAISGIKRHHQGDTAYVERLLHRLIEEAADENAPCRKVKLLSNYRALTDYIEHFGSRQLVIRRGKRLQYVFKNLVVSASPDLIAEENGNLVLVKLNCCKDDFAGGVTNILLHVLYEAAQSNGMRVTPTGVECLQTSSGSRITGSKNGFPEKSVLDAASQELLDLWHAA